jgi:hypothetical protein
MRHATEGTLRRLRDEPSAVPDTVHGHVAGCPHCRARQVRVSRDTDRCARLLAGPHQVPDVDAAWARLQDARQDARQDELRRPAADRAGRRRGTAGIPRRAAGRASGLRRVSLRTAVVIGAAGVVVAGTAAAATLTTVFAPTRVAPLSLSQSDIQSLDAFMTTVRGNVLGGFPSPSGSMTLRFGTIDWATSGKAQTVGSLAQASAAAGFTVTLPDRLPSGVGPVQDFIVQPRVTATITFAASAAGVAGSRVVLDVGPAVAAEYGSSNGTNLPTLAVLAIPRPTAVSTGATTSQIEAFLLRQPGISAQLAEEIRLLGNLGTTLPVPVWPGASTSSVRVDGSPAVLETDASDVAAGVIWEDRAGTVHLVVGALDSRDVLDVARQLG